MMDRDSVDALQTVLSVMREVEQIHEAFGLRWDGLPFWSAFRTVIIDELLGRIADVGPKQQAKGSNSHERLRYAAKNLTVRNPWLAGGRARYLVARWERSQLVDGRDTEPLSDAIGEALPGPVIYLDMTGKMRDAPCRSWSVEAINLAARVLSKRTALEGHTPVLAPIESTIRQKLGVKIDLRALLAVRVRDVAARTRLYRGLLRRAGIEEVWSVVAYANPGLVLAAKSLGIPVVDIQHGLLNFAYDGLGQRTDACMPDKLALFGERWTRAMTDPDGITWSVVGARHIHQRLEEVSPAPREDFLLVLSQPMIREQLLGFALQVATAPGAPRIVYRLHPGDDRAACERMLDSFGRPANLVLDSGGGPGATLALQVRAHAQLGAFSTAVLEGIALRAPTLIFPTTGYSMITPYLDADADIVRSPEALIRRFAQMSPALPSVGSIEPLFARFDPAAVAALAAASSRSNG